MSTPEKRAEKSVYASGEISTAKRKDGKESKRTRKVLKRMKRAAKRGVRFQVRKDIDP